MPSPLRCAVRPASHEDRSGAVGVLRAGFFADPLSVWLIPDDGRRRRFHSGILAAAFDDSLAGGALLVASVDATVAGVAVWYPPGRDADPSGEDMDTAINALTPDDLARLATMRERMAEHHPSGSHYYLWLMAVSPQHHGRGIGAALLKTALERCDRSAQGAYLEATSPDNYRLYRRHGFKDSMDVDLPDGPQLYPMWRNPAGLD